MPDAGCEKSEVRMESGRKTGRRFGLSCAYRDLDHGTKKKGDPKIALFREYVSVLCAFATSVDESGNTADEQQRCCRLGNGTNREVIKVLLTLIASIKILRPNPE